MIPPESYDFASEFYVVEKVVEVVVRLTDGDQAEHIRIEALQGADGNYVTRAYILRDGALCTMSAEDLAVWTEFSLPWTHGANADQAIGQALSILSERVVSKTPK